MTFADPFDGEEHVQAQSGKLLRYARRQLDAAEEKGLVNHLEECAACRRGLVDLRKDFNLPPTILEQETFWDWGHSVIQSTVHRVLPEEMPFFEPVWLMLKEGGLLGKFDPRANPVLAEVGFVPGDTAEVLPSVLGVLSNALLQSEGDALTEDSPWKQEAEESLVRHAHIPQAQAAQLLEQFLQALREKDPE